MQHSDLRRSLFVCVVVSLAACTSHTVTESKNSPSPYPVDWIKQQIAEFDKGAAASTNRVDGEIVFEGESLYLIHSPCCDLFDYLYTADGETFCAPSGGFTGRGDGKCPPGIEPVQRRTD